MLRILKVFMGEKKFCTNKKLRLTNIWHQKKEKRNTLLVLKHVNKNLIVPMKDKYIRYAKENPWKLKYRHRSKIWINRFIKKQKN